MAFEKGAMGLARRGGQAMKLGSVLKDEGGSAHSGVGPSLLASTRDCTGLFAPKSGFASWIRVGALCRAYRTRPRATAVLRDQSRLPSNRTIDERHKFQIGALGWTDPISDAVGANRNDARTGWFKKPTSSGDSARFDQWRR